jgi:hypothetical protein
MHHHNRAAAPPPSHPPAGVARRLFLGRSVLRCSGVGVCLCACPTTWVTAVHQQQQEMQLEGLRGAEQQGHVVSSLEVESDSLCSPTLWQLGHLGASMWWSPCGMCALAVAEPLCGPGVCNSDGRGRAL